MLRFFDLVLLLIVKFHSCRARSKIPMNVKVLSFISFRFPYVPHVFRKSLILFTLKFYFWFYCIFMMNITLLFNILQSFKQSVILPQIKFTFSKRNHYKPASHIWHRVSIHARHDFFLLYDGWFELFCLFAAVFYPRVHRLH